MPSAPSVRQGAEGGEKTTKAQASCCRLRGKSPKQAIKTPEDLFSSAWLSQTRLRWKRSEALRSPQAGRGQAAAAAPHCAGSSAPAPRLGWGIPRGLSCGSRSHSPCPVLASASCQLRPEAAAATRGALPSGQRPAPAGSAQGSAQGSARPPRRFLAASSRSGRQQRARPHPSGFPKGELGAVRGEAGTEVQGQRCRSGRGRLWHAGWQRRGLPAALLLLKPGPGAGPPGGYGMHLRQHRQGEFTLRGEDFLGWRM